MYIQNEIFNHIVDWSQKRIDYLSSRSKACKTDKLKKFHHANSIALEEEYFDWYADLNAGKKMNVLFIPYYKGYRGKSNRSDSKDS